MKYLVTGGTGFLGKYLVDGLEKQGNEVFIATRNPVSAKHVKADLGAGILEFDANVSFDYVVHAAGKAHMVPRTEAEKKDFFDVNVKGTRLLLSQLETLPTLPKGIVFISSVSVYGLDSGTDIAEPHALNATEPYGRSKIEAEQIIQDWGLKNKVTVGIVRLPLIAGQNPPGNLGSMIRGIKTGMYFRIGKGNAKKSMVWAADVADILPAILEKGGIYNLTDGIHPSFAELEDPVCKALSLKPVKRLPLFLAQMLGLVGSITEKLTGRKMPINSRMLGKITNTLTFSDLKARESLGWNPSPVTAHIKEMVL